MEIHKLRREFLKLKCKYSYSKCQFLIKEKFDREFHISTLKRWYKRFSNEEGWNFRDKSKVPNKVYYKVTQELEAQIISFRKKTGYGALKIKQCLNLDIHQDTVNQVLKRNNLTRTEHNRSSRLKYVRFERNHANSLWHIDDSEFGKQSKIIAVVDDATRYCLGILQVKTVTTYVVTKFLDELIQKFGLPTQIISDNGSPYGLKSKYSKFDIWCRRRGIEHIRTRVKRPQTNGKVERLFGSITKEIEFCNYDLEQFRMRYNHFRPHFSLKNKTPAEEFYNFKENWGGSICYPTTQCYYMYMDTSVKSKNYVSVQDLEDTKNFIREEVKNQIYSIINDLSDDEFEDFLRAKRYDKLVEDIENGTRNVIETSK